MTATRNISFTVNGSARELEVETRMTLGDALREKCQLTGTNLGCEHGVCGSCTVLVDDQPVRSCLMFAYQVHGKQVETVEGLAQANGDLHPLQQAFWQHHGVQCGFCTPGFLMLAAGYLRSNPNARDEELKDILSSNLCRCTGYSNIFKAVRSAAEAMRTKC